MLYVLLQQTCFPYKELDLVKLYHWQLFEDLKQSQCTMASVRELSWGVFILIVGQSAISSRILDITIRTPGSPTLVYKVKMYDEQALAPSVSREFVFLFAAYTMNYSCSSKPLL